MNKHRDLAAKGLNGTEYAILGLLSEHSDGLINKEVARQLKLESDLAGQQKN